MVRAKIASENQLNCVSKKGKSLDFTNSILNIFRLRFFNEAQKEEQKPIKGISQAKPNSKTSLRKKAKTSRNKERRQVKRGLQQTRNRDDRRQNLKKGEAKMEVEKN